VPASGGAWAPTAGDLGSVEPDPADVAQTSATVAVSAARDVIGSRYSTGSVGPDAFDCSGLVTYAMQHAGVAVPRTSYAQSRDGERVRRPDIQPGDLVFFNTAGPGASDVGIASGPRTVISATTHGVMEHPIFDSYWGGHFVGARRLA
jgi:cell wall-associated NlpC family hydrolase